MRIRESLKNLSEIAEKSSIDSKQTIESLTQAEYNLTMVSVTLIVTITTYVEGVKT